MESDFDFYKAELSPSRPADYYLGCLNGSVYMDFNKSADKRISLFRISFDGYGCCTIRGKVYFLDEEKSRLFRKEMKQDEPNPYIITPLVLELIYLNRENIWNEPLERYGLI